MNISITQEGHKHDFLLFLHNVMVVGGEDKASDAEMENARVELVQKHQASNMMMFGRLGYILLIATAGTSLQVEALPVGGAARLTTIVPRFTVRITITALFCFPASHSDLPANASQGQWLVTHLLWLHQVHHHLSEFCVHHIIIAFSCPIVLL